MPSFLLIYLKPLEAEGPRIRLFQRDLLLAYSEIDSKLADVVLKYFCEHAVQWMSPANAYVALSKCRQQMLLLEFSRKYGRISKIF